MQDLTKITTPFGLLDDETRLRLVAHGGPYQMYDCGYWVDCNTPTCCWGSSFVRRVKPAPLTKPSIEPGPVITETITRKRPVPGVYGKVHVERLDNGDWNFDARNLCTAPELRAAIATLQQIADAMENRQ
jgi:hypothetical protein